MGPRARGYKEEPAPVAGDPVSHVKIILYTLVFFDLQSTVNPAFRFPCTALFLLWFCSFTIASGWRPLLFSSHVHERIGRLLPDSKYMVCAHLPRHYRSTLPCKRQGQGRRP